MWLDNLHFENPWLLLGLLLLPGLVLLHRRRPRAALLYSRLPADSGGGWRLQLPFYLRVAALGLLIVALARPQLGFAWEESLTQGIDIELALDISGSMGAEDFQPKNRLTVAKQVVRDFVGQRTGDRIGLVVFAGSALTRAPLTTDRRMLDELIDGVQLNTLPDGTAIGVALADAAARLKNSSAKSKVIILVTDGVNNAGAIDPASAAAICKGLGIKVYTIGVGTGGRVPVPVAVRNPITGQREIRRVMMNVQVDRNLLRQIAERTDGRFFVATDGNALEQVFHHIDRLEKTPLKVKKYVRYREVFQPLAWSGVALLLAPLLLAATGVTFEP